MSELLKGAYDLHVHTAPDVVPRKCSDLELAARMRAAGMAGGAVKSHYLDTAGRAGDLRELYPDLNIVGGITLNRAVGGINPWAVERSAQAGGTFAWFPTLEARGYQVYHHRNGPVMPDLSSFVPVLDENDKLLPEVLDVLDVAKKYDLIVGTGHLSAYEGMILLREGLRRGNRMVVTHAELPSNLYTAEQLKEAVRLGAGGSHFGLVFLLHADRLAAVFIRLGVNVFHLPFAGVEHFLHGLEQEPFKDQEQDQQIGKRNEDIPYIDRNDVQEVFAHLFCLSLVAGKAITACPWTAGRS